MKNKLKWLHVFLMRSFINGIPIYFIISFGSELIFKADYVGKDVISPILGFFLIWWLLAGLYFFITILLSKSERENVLSWFFKFKERDEREEIITGRAAKSSFLLMAGILFVSFFISTSRFGYKPRETSGYHGRFTVGHVEIKAHPVDKVIRKSDNDKMVEYNLYDFPVSKTGLLLLLLVIQFGTYRFFSIRYSK